MDWKRLVTSLTIGVFVSFIILLISNDFGITWDEPVYMLNGDTYVSWLMHPSLLTKDKIFAVTEVDIHPPLRKLFAGLTHEILSVKLQVIDNTRGYRISSLLYVFPLVTILGYIAIGQFGYAVGILVPLVFSFLPHVLFLTPLITLDYAVTALWFIAIVAAVHGMKRSVWLAVSGMAIGLTMLTKFYGYLLCVWVAGYGVWYAFSQKNAMPSLKKTLSIVLLACAVCFIGWPWLWTDTFAHLTYYLRLQAFHGGIAEYIFGRMYNFVPWWYTPVMFLSTTPALILILFAVGVFWIIRKGKIWDRLILINAIFPIALFSLPGVMRYDWIRLFLPAYPFVSLVVGRGMVVLMDIYKKRFRMLVFSLIIVGWLFTLYSSIIRIHPWESAYYNEFVGGIAGAHAIGMESEYWGNSYLGVLAWMNGHKSHPMCVAPVTDPFYYYQAMGQIDSDVTFTANRLTCDFYVILMRQGQLLQNPYFKKLISTEKPVYTVSVDGVTLVGVYDIRMVKK